VLLSQWNELATLESLETKLTPHEIESFTPIGVELFELTDRVELEPVAVAV